MKPKRTDELTDREKEILAPYVSNVDAKVFALKNLNPEVIGAASGPLQPRAHRPQGNHRARVSEPRRHAQ